MEIALHQRLDLFLGRLVGTGAHGRAVLTALEVAQVFERLLRDAPQARQSLPTTRANCASERGGEELVLGLDLVFAVGALEELRAESEKVEQAHLVRADGQPGDGFSREAG